MITIIDYGMGNLRSVQKAFEFLGIPILVSSKAKEIEKADKLILPGVGFFETGMKNLNERGLLETLKNMVLIERIPILGICLGMELFTKSSEEGNAAGLGWLDAETVKFDFRNDNNSPKIPHMGWNTTIVEKIQCPLVDTITENDNFYFAHSYFVKCLEENNVVATTHYGINFASIVQKDNIYGVQFHPEKSFKSGFKVLRNFAEKI